MTSATWPLKSRRRTLQGVLREQLPQIEAKPIPITAKKRPYVTAEIDAYLPAQGAKLLPPLRPTADPQRMQQKRTAAKHSAGRSHVARR